MEYFFIETPLIFISDWQCGCLVWTVSYSTWPTLHCTWPVSSSSTPPAPQHWTCLQVSVSSLLFSSLFTRSTVKLWVSSFCWDGLEMLCCRSRVLWAELMCWLPSPCWQHFSWVRGDDKNVMFPIKQIEKNSIINLFFLNSKNVSQKQIKFLRMLCVQCVVPSVLHCFIIFQVSTLSLNPGPHHCPGTTVQGIDQS